MVASRDKQIQCAGENLEGICLAAKIQKKANENLPLGSATRDKLSNSTEREMQSLQCKENIVKSMTI